MRANHISPEKQTEIEHQTTGLLADGVIGESCEPGLRHLFELSAFTIVIDHRLLLVLRHMTIYIKAQDKEAGGSCWITVHRDVSCYVNADELSPQLTTNDCADIGCS